MNCDGVCYLKAQIEKNQSAPHDNSESLIAFDKAPIFFHIDNVILLLAPYKRLSYQAYIDSAKFAFNSNLFRPPKQ